MNYKEFMKIVDKQLTRMTEEEKTEWIHQTARSITEDKREEFLHSLGMEIAADKTNHMNNILNINSVNMEEFRQWCSQIKEGELYFACYGYEEYGDSYRDRDYSYEYSDPEELGSEIVDRIHQADILLAGRDYKMADEIYDTLWNLDFQAYDESMNEWILMDFNDLSENKLIRYHIRKFLINAMYAAYQARSDEERMDAILYYLSCWEGKDIKLEEIFEAGPEEIQGIDQFLEIWTEYLKKTEGSRAGELLAEAFLLSGGIDCLLKRANECSKHPGVYLYGCKKLLEEGKYQECEILSMEGLEKIPQKLVIRGEIADLAVTAARILGHGEIVEKACLQAFYSKSTVNHYLRLFEFENYGELADKGAEIIEKITETEVYAFSQNLEENQINTLSAAKKEVIRFFHGEFDSIWRKYGKSKVYLGWSNNSKGIFVPLFIMLLKKDDEITKAGGLLLSSIANEIGFAEKEGESFQRYFLLWKSHFQITDEQYKKYLKWLEHEVDKRTEAIVGGGHRNSYYKAARLIAALGETMESNGKINGKMSLIGHYKNIHSRKRAFKSEIDGL